MIWVLEYFSMPPIELSQTKTPNFLNYFLKYFLTSNGYFAITKLSVQKKNYFSEF